MIMPKIQPSEVEYPWSEGMKGRKEDIENIRKLMNRKVSAPLLSSPVLMNFPIERLSVKGSGLAPHPTKIFLFIELILLVSSVESSASNLEYVAEFSSRTVRKSRLV